MVVVTKTFQRNDDKPRVVEIRMHDWSYVYIQFNTFASYQRIREAIKQFRQLEKGTIERTKRHKTKRSRELRKHAKKSIKKFLYEHTKSNLGTS